MTKVVKSSITETVLLTWLLLVSLLVSETFGCYVEHCYNFFPTHRRISKYTGSEPTGSASVQSGRSNLVGCYLPPLTCLLSD